jgi:hypothetical protein
MTLLPPDDELELIHTREYEARVYQLSPTELLVRGVVSDRKPPGLYVLDDPQPMELHQMQLELRVSIAKLEITHAEIVFETHPNSACPLIARDYEKLVGLSIARGFTRKIRDLFGGPNGCTHTNALLQAMAPAVVQSMWSISIRDGRTSTGSVDRNSPEARERRIAGTLNTCHIWVEDGEHVAASRRGDASSVPPLPVRNRLRELGRDDSKWE